MQPSDLFNAQAIPGDRTNPNMIWELWLGEIVPNPDYEFIEIEVPGDLRQVVIDTISIPQPTSPVAHESPRVDC